MSESTRMATAEPASPTPVANADDLATWIARAKGCIERGELEAGVAAFRQIAERFPEIPEVFNNLGAVCASMGRFDEAQQAFSRALELAPGSVNARYNRGLMRFKGGDFLAALDDFEQAHALAPADPELSNNLGVTCFQLERWDQARAAFEAALAQAPEYLSALLNLVDVDQAQGQPAAALRRCQELTQRFDDPDVWAKLVECHVQLAQDGLDEAARSCEAALARQGALAAVRTRFGQVVRARQMLLASPDAA